MSDDHAKTNNGSELAMFGAKRFTQSNRRLLDFTLGVQQAFFAEMAQASNEVLGRMRTEIEIASEFVSRIASAHSIHEITTTYSECGQHQANVLREGSQLLFNHSQRLCERTSELLSPPAQA
jgi:hypothetical protein